MPARFEGKNLDTDLLLKDQPQLTELSVYTIRKAERKNLQGLERLTLKSLELRWLFSADLTVVPLPPKLKSLMVWHSNKLRSLGGLEQAAELQELTLRENGPLEDTSALCDLKQLKNLSITGGSGSMQKITSLDAIEGLPIEKLSMYALEGGNLDMSPIARLPNIQELDIHGPNFAPEELAKVAAAYPWFLEQLLDLKDYPLDGMRCKKCGGVQKEMFLRRKKFLWCPKCNQAGIDRTLDEFRALVEVVKAS